MERYQQEVALRDVRFYAYHGFYPDEHVLGNEFLLDICCSSTCVSGKEDVLEHTINYEILYQIAKEEMEAPKKLLETVIHHMLARIKQQFPFVEALKITLKKVNPPFGGDRAKAEVTLSWNRT